MLQKLSKKAVFQDTLRFLFLLAKARYKNFITSFSLLPLIFIKFFLEKLLEYIFVVLKPRPKVFPKI